VTQPVDELTRRLIHVKYAAAAVEETLGSLREAVGRARDVGVTWTQIAEALNISPQSAQDRYDSGGSGHRA
jgi:hypothetical protein